MKVPINIILAMILLALLSTPNSATTSNSQKTFSLTATDEIRARHVGCIETIVFHIAPSCWRYVMGSHNPPDYDSLISSGTLVFIPANPYTGEDLKNTEEYSPGDIHLTFPTVSDPVYLMGTHLGEDDWRYDPDISEPGEFVVAEEFGDGTYITDGRTYIYRNELPVEDLNVFFEDYDPDFEREYHGFPLDDDARVRMFSICWQVEVLFHFFHNELDNVPETFDGWVDLLGRKNPISWTNPYTGEPMTEVPWVNVSNYCEGNQRTGQVPDTSPWQGDDPPNAADLVGNYSYVDGDNPYFPSRTHPVRACAQFYFYLPDGKIAAYLVIAM